MSGFHFYQSENIEFVSVNHTEVRFKEHCHASDFIITLMVNGNAVLTKENTRILYTNDIFMIPPYESHSLISDNKVSLISMCIKKQTVYTLDFTSYQKLIETALTEISSILNLKKNQYRLFYTNALEIYNNFHTHQETENSFKVSRNKIEKFPECENTIEQFANEIYVSKYHYIRKFREISGLTPHQFQIQSRIRMAQKILTYQSQIADIASIVGFFDQSHFNKYFKKVVGISPTEYIHSVSNFLQAKN